MVIYLLLSAFDLVLNFVIGLVPTFETPTWIASNLNNIFETIYGFNQYLPIAEAFVVVIFLLGFTLQYKILKIVLEKAGVNMNA